MEWKKVTPLDTYKTYLSIKNHFTKSSYDYHKYNGKSRANLETFYKRKDRFWFEKLGRQKTDKEIVNFFVANFIVCSDPQSLWIGEIIKEGEERYNNWKEKISLLSDYFKSEIESIFTKENFDSMFNIKNNRHPQLLKEYLRGNVSIETMIILDNILNYKNNFDSKLMDPIWDSVSLKMKKYSSFINVDVFKYKKILKECVL